MTYQLSKEAEQDIVDIYIHTATEFGTEQAERYHDKLRVCFEFLANNPLAAPLRSEIDPPVHIHPLGAHIIVYIEEYGGILVVRVRHQHENWVTA